jgi:hypothetical protein
LKKTLTPIHRPPDPKKAIFGDSLESGSQISSIFVVSKLNGVQTLLDAIADYLPSPVDREAIGGVEVKTGFGGFCGGEPRRSRYGFGVQIDG